MASEFKIGDYVWARLKGFPTWPGKIIEPKAEVKRPADKKKKHFILFLGSDNYAWVAEESLWLYEENRERFMVTQRQPRGFQEAVDAMEELLKKKSKKQSTTATATEDTGAQGDKKTKESRPEKSKTPKSAKTEPAAQKRPAARNSSAPPPKERKSLKPEPEKPTKAALAFDEVIAAKPSASRRSGTSTVKESDSKMFMPDVLPSAMGDSVWSKQVVASPLKIGFLGIGTIGSAMVNNLLKTGHEITIWNRTMSKCRDFIKDGALRGNSPCEVVQECDITFSCVADPSALKDLVFGNSGVLQGISDGKAYVDMSTVDVETMTDVCDAVTARGGRFLEAPVIGNKQLAGNGQLIVLAAGEKSVFDDCASCFQAVGRQTFYLGEMGLATRMRLILGMLVGTTLAGLAESLALASKLGLNTSDVLEVLGQSSASSQFISEKGADIAAGRFSDAGCKLSLMQKDLKLAINMSDAVDQPLHVGSAVNELFKKAKAKGYGENDISAIYKAANL